MDDGLTRAQALVAPIRRKGEGAHRPAGALRLVRWTSCAAFGLLLAACGAPRTPAPGSAPPPGPQTAPYPPVAPTAPPGPITPGAPWPGRNTTADGVLLPTLPPAESFRARNWDDWKRDAALRIAAANAPQVYMGVPPEPLLAIPVLEIELRGDGSVARISVQRTPRQARDTVELATQAIRRVGRFAPVAHLPRPWLHSEVFLFDDDRRFKPRALD